MSIELSAEVRESLILTAREAIASRLEGRAPRWPAYGEAAASPLGAFVTLHKLSAHGRRLLRGCIGRMSSELALSDTIRAMAISAAFEDPRFPPVTDGELEAIDIEISVLTPMERCAPEDVTPGLHGVYLKREYRSGVFLPQVATEQGWDRETLLEQLCVKAGLEAGSYAAPDAKLYRFSAIVFGELEP
ncbi:MAG: AmmeMemoRadiSam system protein A [Spirochaetes bacterium]|nr:AmmeMemoRadiSam system protein A [Spirochaetota bacterium]MBU1080760.1 AmmeMemoRadiSam system protein A [Spirochaetota bacterium]